MFCFLPVYMRKKEKRLLTQPLLAAATAAVVPHITDTRGRPRHSSRGKGARRGTTMKDIMASSMKFLCPRRIPSLFLAIRGYEARPEYAQKYNLRWIMPGGYGLFCGTTTNEHLRTRSYVSVTFGFIIVRSKK